ncbi:MAG: YkgJ family cysteine cluster protein [Crocinitomicaceae bacterium]|nr:YkgJ family cysteine cluster protein [Crocinitomicaceae bacterium]
MIYKDLLGQSKENYLDNRKLIQKLKKSNNREVDTLFHSEHIKVFKKIDCLSCANCCKTTSPIFRDVDVKRIAKRLRMPIGKFIETYLRMDEEKDYVLQTSPCAFLDDDNTCSIYEDRPLACREYPHTDRKNMFQILDLTLTNSLICPAVSEIFTKIKEKGK